MSVHAIDILLRAKDQASKTIKGVNGELGKTGSIGSKAGRGIRTAAVGLAALGGVAAAAVAVNLKAGIDALKADAIISAQTSAVIKSTGGAAGVTAAQIEAMAAKLSILDGVSDDVVQSSENMLLTFTNIGKNVFPTATQTVLDMSAALGQDTKNSAIQLGKALNDPIKGITALQRVGVTFNGTQKKHIKALVAQGKLEQAQRVILRELKKEFGGVAKAQADADPGRRLGIVIETAQKALAKGLLPGIQKVQKRLTELFSDPATIKGIQDFGTAIGGAFDDVVNFAEGVNWGSMVDGLKAAAGWAKGLFDAFSSLPPEAKGIIIGLAGLTKLTGGAPIKIAVDFAKDALSGAFGHFFDRGSSPANPLFVSGGIGAGGPPGGVGGGVASLISKGLIVGAVAELANLASPVITQAGVDIHDAIVDAFKIDIHLPVPKPSELEWPFGPKNTPTILPDIFGGNGILGGTGAGDSGGPGLTGHGGPGRGSSTAGLGKVTSSIATLQHGAVTAVDGTTTAVNASKDAVVAAQGVAGRDITGGVRTAGNQTSNAATGGASRVTTQSIGNTGRIVGAIAANRAIVNTSVVVNVSGSTVTSSQTTQSRTGSGGGSQGNDSYGDGGHGK